MLANWLINVRYIAISTLSLQTLADISHHELLGHTRPGKAVTVKLLRVSNHATVRFIAYESNFAFVRVRLC